MRTKARASLHVTGVPCAFPVMSGKGGSAHHGERLLAHGALGDHAAGHAARAAAEHGAHYATSNQDSCMLMYISSWCVFDNHFGDHTYSIIVQ